GELSCAPTRQSITEGRCDERRATVTEADRMGRPVPGPRRDDPGCRLGPSSELAYLIGVGSGRIAAVTERHRSQEPSAWQRSTWTRTPVLSAERVEVSAGSSNLAVGRGISSANFTPAFTICWEIGWMASRPVTGRSAG